MKKLFKLSISAILSLASVFSVYANGTEDIANNKYSALSRNLELFNSLYKELNMFYVDTINADKTMENAIKYLLNEVDPYTEYITPKEQEDFLVISTGEYGGIGSYIMERKTGGVYISEPYEDSPAARAGLKAGDKILMIDNDTVTKWKSSKVSDALKGQANTKLHLKIQRPYVKDSIMTFDIVREKIKMKAVPYYGMLKNNIGYIQLNTFNENSPKEVSDAFLELKKNKDLKGLILDLRGNGGGLVESAIKIVGFFTPKGTEVLKTRGRLKQSEKTYKTTQDPIDKDIPLIVFIDGASASASEIVSGSLQDLDRAVIIGARSYGKGLVQTTRPLPNEGLLKVTISKYYIPSGRLIQAIDYSRRNPDGSVARTPDSLTNVYKTLHGREVRDGGGITPDITVKYPTLNRLTYNIVMDFWAFDFATKYAAEHKSIGSAEDFKVSDSLYNEFKKFIDPNKFNYDKVCETMLKSLKEAAELEDYLNDSTKAEFEKLEKLLKHDLNKDLDTHREEIEKIIATEIMKRYYYQRGETIEMLKTDKTVNEAYNVFTTPGKYEGMLNPEKKKSQEKKEKSKKKK